MRAFVVLFGYLLVATRAHQIDAADKSPTVCHAAVSGQHYGSAFRAFVDGEDSPLGDSLLDGCRATEDLSLLLALNLDRIADRSRRRVAVDIHPFEDAEALCELTDITPTVPHNVLNVMAAAGLARSLGVPANTVASAMKKFVLDHHRLEVVAVHDGVTWIDDSKATNPHAAIAALHSQIRSIWIAGGLAKGAEMQELVERCHSRIKSAILIGTDAPKIEAALRSGAPHISISRVDGSLSGLQLMRRVVELAAEQAEEGDTVLLAPACASMDQFKNYAERGELFAQAVKEKLGE